MGGGGGGGGVKVNLIGLLSQSSFSFKLNWRTKGRLFS